MEIKINREIRAYRESVFFGLSMRQSACSILAIAAAVIVYLLLHERASSTVTSWGCILSAVPFAFLGFFTYHDMSAEKFIMAFLRSQVIERKVFLLSPGNIYREVLR